MTDPHAEESADTSEEHPSEDGGQLDVEGDEGLPQDDTSTSFSPTEGDSTEESSDGVEESPESKGGKPFLPQDRLDLALSLAMWTLVAALVGVGAWFGYSVYIQRQVEASATPALRLIQDLRVAVTENPNDVALRIRLGEALASAGNYDDAVEQIENALKLEPESPAAYLDLGLIGILTEDLDAAERYLLRVVELTSSGQYAGLDDRRELAFYNLGLIALDRQEYEDAIGYLKGALRIRRDASDSYYYLALAYQGLDEVDASFKQLDIALAFDPNYPQAHFLMGELYMSEEDEVNASYHFYLAAENAPDADPPQEALASFGTPEERLASAQEFLDNNDIEAALLQVLVARNLDPENVDAAVLHGEVLIVRTNFSDAVEVFQEALDLAGGTDKHIKARIEEAMELAE